MAFRIFKRLAELLDVDTSGVSDGDALTYDAGSSTWVPGAGGGGGGAPTDVNYLVGTADGDLSNEIVVGTSPGGELGGTWASPTVDATHSGSSHASVQAAAEATAASALSSHASDTTGVHGISDTSALLDTGDIGSSVAAQSHVHAGEDITTGTVADARIASTIARDSEVAAGYQPLDSDLTAIAGLSPSNDDVVQRKGGAWTNRTIAQLLTDLAAAGTTFQPKDTTLDTYAGIDPSANVQSILSAADYAAIRTLLGLVIGTNVQAYDADLTTYAGITPSANVQSLLGAADYAAMRTLLGLVIGTNVQAYDAELAALAGLTSAADRLPYFTGSGTAALATFTSAARSLLDDADAAAMRETLLVPGVQMAYAEYTSNVTISASSSATANTVVTAPAFTADGTSSYIVETQGPTVSPGNGWVAVLYEGSTEIGNLGYSNAQVPFHLSRKVTPSSGSRTYSLRAYKTGGSNATFESNSGGAGNFLPGFIRVTRAA